MPGLVLVMIIGALVAALVPLALMAAASRRQRRGLRAGWPAYDAALGALYDADGYAAGERP
jgi:hypothetical protein